MSAQFAAEKQAGQLSLMETAVPACRFWRARTSTVTTGMFDGSAKRMSAGELNALAGIPDADKNGPLPGTVSLPNAMWCNPGNTNGTPDSE